MTPKPTESAPATREAEMREIRGMVGDATPGLLARVELFEGRVYTFRFCEECCAAMASSWSDGGEAWLARSEMGSRKARRRASGGDHP